jgi:hydroxypyruvate reductase
MSLDPRAFLRSLFDAAIAAAQPERVIAPHLPPPPRGRTVVLGAGKAGGAMAAAVDALWPANAPLSGLVVTRYDHVPPA